MNGKSMSFYWLKIIWGLSLVMGSHLVYGQVEDESVDILVIGGGASGTMAGVQAARMGKEVLIVEETPWLGGMLTAAGVSAIDGNYRLPSGLWEEFRQDLVHYYGGAENLKTGWVSNVLFEPQVGEQLLRKMVAAEKHLRVWDNTPWKALERKQGHWQVKVVKEGREQLILAKVVIDATELGDVAASVGIPYDMGMDAKEVTGEEIASEKANQIIQDLTYVAILKDFGPGADKTIPRPKGYDPEQFANTCARDGKENPEKRLWDCDRMMTYGKLPNDYYMINWPINGNDYYLNLLEKDREERDKLLLKAKEHTLKYVYYLQHELGYKNLGIADDVYPTLDGLPFIPYHRESRRIKGAVRFTVNDLAEPFRQKKALYRTGIAVGDYPIDHHHEAYPDEEQLPDLHFYPVPSYSLPLGTLIPREVADFIVAEKSISVTNIVNGTTRLQPVCLLIGQAAGALATLSVEEGISPGQVPVRAVQSQLLESGAMLMPYSDVSKTAKAYLAVQKVGATGILRGEGKNVGWENHTFFYPDSLLRADDLMLGLEAWLERDKLEFEGEYVTKKEAVHILELLYHEYLSTKKPFKQALQVVIHREGLSFAPSEEGISRADFASLLDALIDPFFIRGVDHFGDFTD
ncbi:FAD-dependent oxidoreductase [Echinicola sediminis]